ncbi:MAG: galactokinase [Actinomycetota bacterium]
MRCAVAPGRVNLIGDHTDYQDGWCLPMAIDRSVAVSFVPRTDGRVRARSDALSGPVDLPADGSTDIADLAPVWGRTVAAALSVLAEAGRNPVGADLHVRSTVPVGSGLSSSAAFGVAVTMALAEIGGLDLDGPTLARTAQSVEHRASGVPCGIMDQLASVCGRAGHALLLDCRTLGVTPIPVPPEAVFVVVHSGEARRLVDSAYAARRAACEETAAGLGLAALRDAEAHQVVDVPFARHVVSENARTLAFAEALRIGDLDACGALMLESHGSLRDDFGVSTTTLDELVVALMGAGARGARFTGAGFGGCAVALFDPVRAPAAAERFGGFVVRAADGARITTEEES